MKASSKLTGIALVALTVATLAARMTIEAETAPPTHAPTQSDPSVDGSAGKWRFPGFKPGEVYPDVERGKVTGQKAWDNILDEIEKYERDVPKATIDWMRQNPPEAGEDMDAYFSRAPAPEL
jgi:hypothetical protein